MSRDDFEKLPKIKQLIEKYELFYCEKADWYLSPNDEYAVENFVDGAWYAYKEINGE